ncbi:hypothetical protein AAG906_003199 [Vitis piasezkii]
MEREHIDFLPIRWREDVTMPIWNLLLYHVGRQWHNRTKKKPVTAASEAKGGQQKGSGKVKERPKRDIKQAACERRKIVGEEEEGGRRGSETLIISSEGKKSLEKQRKIEVQRSVIKAEGLWVGVASSVIVLLEILPGFSLSR